MASLLDRVFLSDRATDSSKGIEFRSLYITSTGESLPFFFLFFFLPPEDCDILITNVNKIHKGKNDKIPKLHNPTFTIKNRYTKILHTKIFCIKNSHSKFLAQKFCPPRIFVRQRFSAQIFVCKIFVYRIFFLL